MDGTRKVDVELARRPGIAGQILRPVGWALVVLGLATLEFAAFVLWGTSRYTKSAQAEMRRDFSRILTTDLGLKTTRPDTGDGIARIVIPKIGVDAIVVGGVSHEDLMKGPGHIPETAFPGSDGASVISGHRSTYAAPFANLDRLEPGDRIIIQTFEGETNYTVAKSFIVLPSDTSVTLPLKPGERPRLTLTTCNPRFSAAQRLIVVSERDAPPGPFVTPQ